MRTTPSYLSRLGAVKSLAIVGLAAWIESMSHDLPAAWNDLRLLELAIERAAQEVHADQDLIDSDCRDRLNGGKTMLGRLRSNLNGISSDIATLAASSLSEGTPGWIPAMATVEKLSDLLGGLSTRLGELPEPEQRDVQRVLRMFKTWDHSR